MKRTHIVFLLLAIILILSAASCGSGETGVTPETEEPVNLTVAIDNDEGLLTPMNWNTWVGFYLTDYVYDTLVGRDLSNAPAPRIAKEWEVSDDGRVWDLTLRDDVKWHDGEKLTAQDVIFTFEANRKRRPTKVKNIESIEANGDYEVTITLKELDAFFITDVLMEVQLIPDHIWKDVEFTEERTPFAAKVGSGPFQLAEMEANEFYRLTANPDFWGGEPMADEIVAKIIKDRPAQFQALKAGEVDAVVVSIPSTLVEELNNTEGVELAQGADFFNYNLNLNTELAPFNQVEVRRAVSLAIDRQRLVDLVMQGQATILPLSYYHPELPYVRKDVEPIHDVEEANRVLDDLGLKDSDGDGLREHQGAPMSYELLCDSNNPAEVRTAELLNSMLGDIGIEITNKCLDIDTVMSFVWPKFHAKNGRDYDMNLHAWSAGTMQRRSFIRSLVHSNLEEVGWANVTAYSNPEMDALLDELVSTVDPERQDEIQQQIANIFAQTLPFIPLFSPDGNFAYRPDSYDGWLYTQGLGILPRASFSPGFH